MEELIVTFGLLMGMEFKKKQNTGAGKKGNEVLLIFCLTGESREGKIDITPLMLELELIGFRPVAINRWNLADPENFAIYAKKGLSESMQNAVLNDTGSVVREAVES